jgi:hypothetical protein
MGVDDQKPRVVSMIAIAGTIGYERSLDIVVCDTKRPELVSSWVPALL